VRRSSHRLAEIGCQQAKCKETYMFFLTQGPDSADFAGDFAGDLTLTFRFF
jgi:hypothetical protein